MDKSVACNEFKQSGHHEILIPDSRSFYVLERHRTKNIDGADHHLACSTLHLQRRA